MKNKNVIIDDLPLVKNGKLTLLGFAFILDVHDSLVKQVCHVIFEHKKGKKI